MFYYCSGKDATPIVAFGSEIPLYVYSDSFKYMRLDFNSAVNELYSNIEKACYKRECTRRPPPTICKNAELSLWKDEKEQYFILLYTESDAINLYEKIYLKQKLRPKYFCNSRYEMSNRGILEREERAAEYILGHCHYTEFSCVGEHEYLGDYSFGTKTAVKLYQREIIS